VYGAGPIGQAIVIVGLDRGARLLVVDLEASRLELATEMGAEAAVNPRVESVEDCVAAWTSGDGPIVIFEATGVPSVLSAAIDLVAPSGSVVMVGVSAEEVPIPMVQVTRKELTILGSRNNAGVFGQAVDVVRLNRDRVERLISHRFPFDAAAEAFELACTNPSTTEKVMILIA
jgi:L-gulonate 5-dehydrogenase